MSHNGTDLAAHRAAIRAREFVLRTVLLPVLEAYLDVPCDAATDLEARELVSKLVVRFLGKAAAG